MQSELRLQEKELQQWHHLVNYLEKAWLYIEKFDALSGSQDEIYEKIPEKMMDQASEGQLENAEVSSDFVTNSLLAGYYVRTHEEPLQSIPAVRAEEARIRSDYEFVETANAESFLKRLHEYMEVLIIS